MVLFHSTLTILGKVMTSYQFKDGGHRVENRIPLGFQWQYSFNDVQIIITIVIRTWRL